MGTHPAVVDWHGVREALGDLCEAAYENSRAHGFWEEGLCNTGEKIALIHSEASEALEEYRNGQPLTAIRMDERGKPEGFGVELADILIRVFDLAGRNGINMAECLKMKMAYNATRPAKHGKVC